ncbi:hypothetical protein KIPB_011018 [Kipferlia bialata]|uniref:Uncharacterized protein n=1 Tax=Kipferlia bialata TaxID=797122 RepID=A0A9K3GN06_9EUKA|nr:hypothetical protein KIPB_011018 [Kipferlia bialata]|eukprot:g11018.t1
MYSYHTCICIQSTDSALCPINANAESSRTSRNSPYPLRRTLSRPFVDKREVERERSITMESLIGQAPRPRRQRECDPDTDTDATVDILTVFKHAMAQEREIQQQSPISPGSYAARDIDTERVSSWIKTW